MKCKSKKVPTTTFERIEDDVMRPKVIQCPHQRDTVGTYIRSPKPAFADVDDINAIGRRVKVDLGFVKMASSL